MKKYFLLVIISLLSASSYGQFAHERIIIINGDTLIGYTRAEVNEYQQYMRDKEAMLKECSESLAVAEAENEMGETLRENLAVQLTVKTDELRHERAKIKFLKVSFIALLTGLGAAFTATKL